MRLARVEGNIVATRKHPSLDGRRLVVCQPINLEGEDDGTGGGRQVEPLLERCRSSLPKGREDAWSVVEEPSPKAASACGEGGFVCASCLCSVTGFGKGVR